VNKKFGILQVIETRNIVGMFNQPVTLSFTAKTTGTSIGNMKAVILSWTGTSDTVTRDVVSAWGADGVTPTFAANWTAENTPQNLAPSNDWTRYEITANLDTASTNNVAVFIWCDDMTTTLGDFLYITDVQLEVGALATPFERRLMNQTLADCQRYYWRFTSDLNDRRLPSLCITFGSGTSAQVCVFNPVTMRGLPNSLDFSNLGITDNVAFTATGGTWALLTQFSSPTVAFIGVGSLTGSTDGTGRILTTRSVANSYIGISAEL